MNLSPKFEKLMDGVDKLKPNSALPAKRLCALLWHILYHETAACVIRFRNLQQVKMNLSAADKGLTKEEFTYIKEAFL